MSNQQLPRSERLKKGASFLGKLWMNPQNRCPDGWTISPCTCQPAREFCKARNLWVTLAIEDWIDSVKRGEQDGREMDDGPFGLSLSMRASEWDAVALQMKIEHPEIGLISIGSPVSCVTGMVDMAKMMDAPEVLASTLRVLKAFPKSRVEGLSDPVEAPAVLGVEIPMEMAVEANPDEAFE